MSRKALAKLTNHEVSSMEEKKKVVLKKTSFSGANRKKYELRKKEVEVPELNSLMGLKEDEVAVIVVRQLELPEMVEIRGETINYARNLAEGILEASYSSKEVKQEAEHALYKSLAPDARQMIDTLEVGIVEPKLTRDEILFISKMFASVVDRLFREIMTLTKGGASLKKNSSE